MKGLLLALIIFSLSGNVFGEQESLCFTDKSEVRALVVKKDLPTDFIRLHRPFSPERMIAGRIVLAEKKPEKKSFIDGLRSRLLESKGFSRF